MIVPLCPMCGHKLYLVGAVGETDTPFPLVRYVCLNCDHVEDIVCVDTQDKEVLG
jgi:DNA-directed RNA polymerase subunit RPC12/RpoP